MLALAESPASASIARAIATFIGDAGNAGDRWLREGAISAGARNDREFLKSLVAAAPGSITPEQGEVLQTVSRHFAHSGSTEELMAFVVSLKSAHESRANAALEGLIAGWENAKTPTLTPVLSKSLTELMTTLPETAKTRLLALSRSWGKEAETLFAGQRASILDGLAKRLADVSLAADQRVTAANGLVRLEDNAATAAKVLDQVTIQAEPKLVGGLFAALADGRDVTVGQSILDRWGRFTPAQRRAALGTLTRRSEWSGQLLGAIEAKSIPAGDLGPQVWQQLRQSRDRRIAAQAARLADADKPISADREAVVKRLLPVAKLKGDAERGKAVYAQNCLVCHALDGQGGKVGPELTGIGARDRADILTEILDPNRSVEANFRLWNVTTKDGETLSGRLDAETQTAVEILDLSGTKHSVQRKDIASLESSPLSIMPTGFEQIPESDLAALLEYLAHSNHPPGK